MTQDATEMNFDSVKKTHAKAQLHMQLKSDTYSSPLFSPQTVKDRRSTLGSGASDSSQKNKIYTYWEITGNILLLILSEHLSSLIEIKCNMT